LSASLPGPNYLPEALRGRWTDTQTFVLDYDRVSGREGWIITLRFEGDTGERVIAQGEERSGDNIQAAGGVQSP
jgi:hypothetical protein